MAENETTPARPDLSALPWETRVNLVLAELVDGAKWMRDRGGWALYGEEFCLFWLRGDGECRKRSVGRNYLNDPAAAWSLMEREGIWTEPMLDHDFNISEWSARFRAGPRHYSFTRSFVDRRRAVCVAALKKYADGPFSDAIRPLLENVP